MEPSVPVVVIDTNLFVAAFWNTGSASASIIRACEAGELVMACTDAIERELHRIMGNIGATAAYNERVRRLLEKAVRVEPSSSPVTTEDRDDQKFLECAVAAEADFLITSDEHLLRVKQVGGAAIVTPTDFVRRASLRG